MCYHGRKKPSAFSQMIKQKAKVLRVSLPDYCLIFGAFHLIRHDFQKLSRWPSTRIVSSLKNHLNIHCHIASTIKWATSISEIKEALSNICNAISFYSTILLLIKPQNICLLCHAKPDLLHKEEIPILSTSVHNSHLIYAYMSFFCCPHRPICSHWWDVNFINTDYTLQDPYANTVEIITMSHHPRDVHSSQRFVWNLQRRWKQRRKRSHSGECFVSSKGQLLKNQEKKGLFWALWWCIC